MCSTKRKYSPGAGYTNYITHLSSQHPDYKAEYAKEKLKAKKESKPMDKYLNKKVTKKGEAIWNWIDWVINENLPFSFVESSRARQYANIDAISVHTFKKYIEALYLKIKKKIEAILTKAKTFGLIIDGWSNESDHYMAIFATLVETDTNGKCNVLEILLSCNVQEDITEETITTEPELVAPPKRLSYVNREGNQKSFRINRI
jgi:hypothetical protein